MLYLLGKLAALRFRRHFQALDRARRTANHDSGQRMPPHSMSPYSNDAPRCGQCAPIADNSCLIAKQHQIFAQYFDRLGDVMKIARRADHNPIAAKPFARRRPGPTCGISATVGFFDRFIQIRLAESQRENQKR